MHVTHRQPVEQRRVRRWHLVLYLRVFNEGGELLGHLANISQDGMMIISDQPMEIDREYTLCLELPKAEFGEERLELKAHSVRCDQDINPSFYDTGFRLLDASRYTVNRIAQLISDLRMGS